MKLFLVLLSLSLFISASAQDCKGYYYLKAGEVEMTLYDRKNSETGKLKYLVSDVSKAGAATVATFNSEMFNEKGKSLSKSTGKYKCENGVLFVDAKVAMAGDPSGQFNNTDVKAVENFIEYPSDLSEGKELKDVSATMEVEREGGMKSTVYFEQTNRKVAGKESVTTPAGTWECWKITYNAQMKLSMGGIGIPVRMKVTEWFAPGLGIIKSETLNKNGKMMGSMILTKLQK